MAAERARVPWFSGPAGQPKRGGPAGAGPCGRRGLLALAARADVCSCPGLRECQQLFRLGSEALQCGESEGEVENGEPSEGRTWRTHGATPSESRERDRAWEGNCGTPGQLVSAALRCACAEVGPFRAPASGRAAPGSR